MESNITDKELGKDERGKEPPLAAINTKIILYSVALDYDIQ